MTFLASFPSYLLLFSGFGFKSLSSYLKYIYSEKPRVTKRS